MAIEFKEGRYFAAVWFVSGIVRGTGESWLCALYRDKDGPWRITYRFRYYAKDEPQDQGGEASWYEATAKVGATEEDVRLPCEVVAKMSALRMRGTVERIDLGTDDVDVIFAALAKADWCHVRVEPTQMLN